MICLGVLRRSRCDFDGLGARGFSVVHAPNLSMGGPWLCCRHRFVCFAAHDRSLRRGRVVKSAFWEIGWIVKTIPWGFFNALQSERVLGSLNPEVFHACFLNHTSGQTLLCRPCFVMPIFGLMVSQSGSSGSSAWGSGLWSHHPVFRFFSKENF